jgi:hypothetical protein
VTRRTNQAKSWWGFFPLKGLEITNQQSDLSEPIFQDATIISRNQVDEIVPLLKLNETMAPGHNHEADFTYMFKNAALRWQFESFIAVRRTGIISPTSHDPQVVEDMRSRAYSVAALLSLVFFARSPSGKTCGLVEQLHEQVRNTVLLTLKEPDFRFQARPVYSYTIDSRRPIRTSRDDIIRMLHEEPYDALSRSVLSQRVRLAKSLRHTIVRSSVRLSDALHAITLSSQLLGAITAIEILLTVQVDKYDIIKDRIAALLGTDADLRQSMDEIFQTRHLYVHQGKEVQDHKTSLRAIMLALSCLVRYAQAAQWFSGKTELVSYLDFVGKAGDLASGWDKAEQRAFQHLLKHEGGSIAFCFEEKLLKERSKV